MPKIITEAQIQQIQGTLEALSFTINKLTGIQETNLMLQNLQKMEESDTMESDNSKK